MEKYSYLVYLIFITSAYLWADISATGTINQGLGGNSVDAVFNKGSTTVTVTIAVDGTNDADYNNDAGRLNLYVKIYYDIQTVSNNLWSGAGTAAKGQFTSIGTDNNLRNAPSQLTTNSLSYIFNLNNLTQIGAEENKYIDFKIGFVGSSNSTELIGSLEDVSFDGATPYFRFDQTVPEITWSEPANNSNDTIFFNVDTIKYTLSEDLSTTYDSFIRFTGTDGVHPPIHLQHRLHH